MKTITKLMVITVSLFMATTAKSQFSEPAADVMFYDYATVNGDFEALNQTIVNLGGTAPAPSTWRYGILGWFNQAYQADPQTNLDVANSGIETSAANVLQGNQSLRIKTNGAGSYSVSMTTNRVGIDQTGTYFWSFWSKSLTTHSSSPETYSGQLSVYNNADASLQSAWTGIYTSSSDWQKNIFSLNVTNASAVKADLKIQMNYVADTYWFDNAKLIRRNDNTLANFYESFNNGDFAPVLTTNNLGSAYVDAVSNALKVNIPYPTQSEEWPGFNNYVNLSNIKIKPSTVSNFIVRWRVKLESGATGLYAWDKTQSPRVATTQAAGDIGKFNMEVKVYKNAGVSQVGSSITPVLTVIDNGWMLCEAIFDQTYFDALVGSDYISRISISFGNPGRLYHGIAYIDDIRFGFPQTVTNSAITATTVESGNGTFYITPSRACDLYAVPTSTVLNKTALDAAVTAGTGFKFTNLTGGSANELHAPYAMNTVGGNIEYLLVSYRSDEDFSTNSADKITVSKGTATSIEAAKIYGLSTSFNAVSNSIQINCPKEIERVAIYTVTGGKVYDMNGQHRTQICVNANSLSNGIYLVKVSADGKTVTSKIQK
jgi:hypothetical protein